MPRTGARARKRLGYFTHRIYSHKHLSAGQKGSNKGGKMSRLKQWRNSVALGAVVGLLAAPAISSPASAYTAGSAVAGKVSWDQATKSKKIQLRLRRLGARHGQLGVQAQGVGRHQLRAEPLWFLFRRIQDYVHVLLPLGREHGILRGSVRCIRRR